MANLNMKTNLFYAFARPVIMAAVLLALPALASKAPQVEALKKSLKAVPVLEMPAKAAQLVSEAKADEREFVAVTVVVAAAQIRPAAIAAVVGAVVRVVPELAPSVAVAAVTQQPKQASEITQAAAAAAPSQAGKIVSAVTQKASRKNDEASSSQGTLETAALPQVMPTSLPRLTTPTAPQPALQPALAGRPVVLGLAGPPVVGPPFTSPPLTPTEIGAGNTVVVPPGGSRDYASP
jgi:hypothetical protein